MTQIVYYDGVLATDRKVYRADGSVFEQTKLKTLFCEDKVIYYAFSGTISECNFGERIIEAENEADRRRLISEAYDRLRNTDVDNSYYGIAVEVPTDPHFAKQHKVFLVNYFGEKIEVESKGFVAVGAMSSELHAAFKAVKGAEEILGSSINLPFVEWLIRTVTRGTAYDQLNYRLDVVKCDDY